MKRIIYSLVIICFFLGNLVAQEESSAFRLELSTQSIFALDDIADGGLGFGLERVESFYNYAVHLSAFRKLSNRLDLGLGFGFANRDASTICYCDFCDKFIPINFGTYTRIRSLEVPIELRIDWFKKEKKIQPYFSFGVTGKIPLLSKKVDGKWTTTIDDSKFRLGVNTGLGTQILLTKKWALIFAASLTFQDITLRINGDGFDRPSEFSRQKWEEWALKFGVSRSF